KNAKKMISSRARGAARSSAGSAAMGGAAQTPIGTANGGTNTGAITAKAAPKKKKRKNSTGKPKSRREVAGRFGGFAYGASVNRGSLTGLLGVIGIAPVQTALSLRNHAISARPGSRILQSL